MQEASQTRTTASSSSSSSASAVPAFRTSAQHSFLPYDPIVIVRDVVKRWMWILTAVIVLS